MRLQNNKNGRIAVGVEHAWAIYQPLEYSQNSEAANRRVLELFSKAGIPVVLLDGDIAAYRMAQDVAPEATFRNVVLDADSSLVVSGNFIMGDGSGEEGVLDLGHSPVGLEVFRCHPML